MTKLASKETADLDPNRSMAFIGKQMLLPNLGDIAVAGTKA